MDVVLGVSMTPMAVRMALVEGKDANGVTLDRDSFDVAGGISPATSDAPEQVVAAILGTRESADEGGHHLVATGVAWTDHAAAARLRQALKAQRIEDVVLVSELHAAGALAQAIGQAADFQRTALLFLERDTATLAVVRSDDGSVIRVVSRSLNPATAVAELQEMVAGLETGVQPPQTLFMVGSGVDIAALKPQISARTSLPVHAPEDGDLALARGAALAAANTPRYEAATVGLLSTEDTAAGPTQMAAAGYMAPLGYSAVPDDDADDLDIYGLDAVAPDLLGPRPDVAPAERRFVLLGSALSTVFVLGVVALVISLAVAIRPTADQRPVPGDSAVVSNSQASVPPQARQPAPPPAAPETIEAPIPVVQEAPRTVFVTPREAVPAPAPAAPAPAAPAPAPAPAAPPPSAPVPAPIPAPAPVAAPAPVPAPAPAFVPPIVVPIPIVPPLLPPIFQVPTRSTPVPRYPTTTATPTPTQTPTPTPTPSATYPTSSAPRITQPTAPPSNTGYPTYTPPVTTIAPDYGSSGEGSAPADSGSSGDSSGDQIIWPPLWPFGG